MPATRRCHDGYGAAALAPGTPIESQLYRGSHRRKAYLPIVPTVSDGSPTARSNGLPFVS
jgi:hypothetical protein